MALLIELETCHCPVKAVGSYPTPSTVSLLEIVIMSILANRLYVAVLGTMAREEELGRRI